MPLNQSQTRVINEEIRSLSEAIRGLVARYQAMNARWVANDMDSLDNAELINDRPEVPVMTVAELKAVKAAFDALNTAATSDPTVTLLVNKMCVRPLSTE